MTNDEQSRSSDPVTAGAINRRELLAWPVCGLGGAALLSLLGGDGFLRAASVPGDSSDPPPHLPPKAKRAIHIFLCGGLSQIDSFDYRPELERLHGQPLPSGEKPDVFFGQVGLLRKPDWSFRQRGESGLWISELFPHLAEQADLLTVIRSMTAE